MDTFGKESPSFCTELADKVERERTKMRESDSDSDSERERERKREKERERGGDRVKERVCV